MSDKLVLTHDVGVPVAYIDLVSDRDPVRSVKQVVVEIDNLGFTPRELIFDLDEDERVTGVELL